MGGRQNWQLLTVADHVEVQVVGKQVIIGGYESWVSKGSSVQMPVLGYCDNCLHLRDNTVCVLACLPLFS